MGHCDRTCDIAKLDQAAVALVSDGGLYGQARAGRVRHLMVLHSRVFHWKIEGISINIK